MSRSISWFSGIFLGIFKSLKEKLGDIGLNKEQEKLPEIPLEEPKRRNPFMKEEIQEKYSTLDAAMEALTGLTVKRNMSKKISFFLDWIFDYHDKSS